MENTQIEVTQKPIHKTIDFVKENGLWYVDLPDFLEGGFGFKGNLLMVAGADTFLEKYSYGNDRVTVTVSNSEFENCKNLVNCGIGYDAETLIRYNHPPVNSGGYYLCVEDDHMMWLCPTLLYVFETDEYPTHIYFYIHPIK